jgi:hypothetical protein
VPVWEFTLTPKPTAAVVWGRIVEEVRKTSWRLLRRVPGEKEAVQKDLEANP